MVKTACLCSGGHFVRMVCSLHTPARQHSDQLVELQLLASTELGLLPNSSVQVCALTMLHFGAFPSPCPGFLQEGDVVVNLERLWSGP